MKSSIKKKSLTSLFFLLIFLPAIIPSFATIEPIDIHSFTSVSATKDPSPYVEYVYNSSIKQKIQEYLPKLPELPQNPQTNFSISFRSETLSSTGEKISRELIFSPVFEEEKISYWKLQYKRHSFYNTFPDHKKGHLHNGEMRDSSRESTIHLYIHPKHQLMLTNSAAKGEPHRSPPPVRPKTYEKR